ncbi:sensor histidine kinase [Parahaliea aestuarii]|uniref:Signal transduction histidine kinase subgroup 3 dimerisation and phosphoacceptor domain-containing protein n=1 Tax=Parahaliea aestuarii TaxID=1852021 RepID=A0A5C9A485_9GAMM|nr:histidine kinase [Parahaliea aestuarii]TXS94814.1 hypothetical protein FVW59_02590 [Parahaliea aestuarii]
MPKWLREFGLDRASAVLTWGLVASTSLYFLLLQLQPWHWRVLLAGFLYLAFLALFLALSHSEIQGSRHYRAAGMSGLYALVVALYFTVPFGFTGVLMAVWCALLPYFLPLRLALCLSPLLSLPLWLVYRDYWQQEDSLLNALLFWALNLFAMITMNNALQERRAREAADELNRRLQATRTLLNEASRQSERTRIARNIHDLLGHHLTALSLHLQVAARRSEGEVRDTIERCHAIAGLLLSDVREAVSELREHSGLDLHQALVALTRNIPRLQVDLKVTANPTDLAVAETILACVQESLTNSLRHSGATLFSIELMETNGGLDLRLGDNGACTPPVQPGNGLRGLRERVAALDGHIAFRASPAGFETRVQLPGDQA